MKSALTAVACTLIALGGPTPEPSLWKGASQDGLVLARYDFTSDPDQRWRLPNRLREVSGLALTDDGHLLAHDDERARVYRVDPEAGEIVSYYDLGDGGLRADFEGIAVLGDLRFLVTSNGTVFRFRDAPDRGSAPYEAQVTALRRRCEVEGLAARAGELLISCKESRVEELSEQVVVFAFDPTRMELDSVPRYSISWDEIREAGGPRRFSPSAIEVDPSEDRVVLLAGRQNALIELDETGGLAAVRRLDDDRHRQPEGLAIGLDGRLYVADEGSGGRARLAFYSSPDP